VLPALLSLLTEDGTKLKSLRIATKQEIDDNVHSELVIKTEFGNYCLSMAPVEVYSASSLRLYHHERKIMRLPVGPRDENEVNIYIGNGVKEFMDSMTGLMGLLTCLGLHQKLRTLDPFLVVPNQRKIRRTNISCL
jgi:hypothetical protein